MFRTTCFAFFVLTLQLVLCWRFLFFFFTASGLQFICLYLHCLKSAAGVCSELHVLPLFLFFVLTLQLVLYWIFLTASGLQQQFVYIFLYVPSFVSALAMCSELHILPLFLFFVMTLQLVLCWSFFILTASGLQLHFIFICSFSCTCTV